MPPPPPAPPPGWSPDLPPAAGWAPLPAQRSGLAIAALVLGIIGLVACFIVLPSLLAFIFGLVAAKRIKRSHGVLGGLGMARAGWILGLIGLLAGSSFIVAAALGAFDDDGDARVSDLNEGDCVNIASFEDEEQIARVPRIECSELHDGEVFVTGELNPDRDRDYPGEEAVQREVADECSGDAFEDYVGVSYGESEFEVFYIYPQSIGWRGQRGQYLCMLYSLAGETLRGSMANSGR